MKLLILQSLMSFRQWKILYYKLYSTQ
jgi:hypothetical protein